MSIRKRKLANSEIRWQVDYRDGNGVRRHRQFSTKREADAFNVRARSEVTAGVHTPDSTSITVAEAAVLWLARCERDRLEPTTLVTYRQYADLHIIPYIGPIKLARLTVPAVTAFRDRLLDDSRSPDMVKRVLKSLGTIVSEAQARGLVATNNVRNIAKLKRERRAERIEMPSRAELQAIIAATPARHRPLILTATLTGMRGSELRGLIWGDVDLQRGEIHVRRRVDRFNKFGAPKSEAGTRTIPMSPLLLNTLRQWRLACPKAELNLVFPNGIGRIESHANLLHRVFWPVQIAAGVTVMRDGEPDAKYSLHALRHACAALWIEQGFGAKRIQTMMGHASVTQTFDRYGYLFEAREADTAAMGEIAAKIIGK
ncbi:MAG: tyrosine-type recombinase/integrase [Bdellovibrionota bacterium]